MGHNSFLRFLKKEYSINLNPQQEKAVISIEGPSLLLSVPGGGKTTVIVSRCANMVLNHKINPANILTLTFSKASARDMGDRFNAIFGNKISRGVKFSTIHSFCYSVIREYTRGRNRPFPQIIEGNSDSPNKNQILRQLYLEINGEFIADDILEELSNTISFLKNMLYTMGEIKEMDIGIKRFIKIYDAYERLKRRERYIDFDDMLTGVYSLFMKNGDIIKSLRQRYQYINVDESQDTSLVQHKIIRMLAHPRNNIFMVGDEDQSIYGFRAAFPQALLEFKKTYPGARILLMERNYRSTPDIVKVANDFIKQNKERYEKNMFTENKQDGGVVFKHVKDREEQYLYIASQLSARDNLSDCAVLYRNNISSIALADHLEYNGILFYIRDTNIHFFKHWVVKDIIAFIKFALDSQNITAFKRIYFKMGAYLSKEMFEYTLQNQGKERNVFETLLNFPQMPKNTADMIKLIISQLRTLKFLDPYRAIEYIEKNMGYEKYIKRASKELGFSLEIANYIIASLKTIASRVETFTDFFKRLAYLNEVIVGAGKNKYKNAVFLSTIHSSKGLEFDKVYMLDLVDGQFPSTKSIGEHEQENNALMEEEVRLFYVGITRAKRQLELLSFSRANKKKSMPSRFVHQIMLAKGRLSYDKIQKGIWVEHICYGIGQVRKIEKDKDIVAIKFGYTGEKRFSLDTCMKEGKIRIINGGEHHKPKESMEEGELTKLSIGELRGIALKAGKGGKYKKLLPQLFLHDDYEVRRRACSAARRLKDAKITLKIRPCLYAKEPQVRQYALKAILSSGCTALIEDIKKVLETEDKCYNIDLCRKILEQFG